MDIDVGHSLRISAKATWPFFCNVICDVNTFNWIKSP